MFLYENVNTEIRKKHGELFGESIILENIFDIDFIQNYYTEDDMFLHEAGNNFINPSALNASAQRFIQSIRGIDLNIDSNLTKVQDAFNKEIQTLARSLNVKAQFEEAKHKLNYEARSEEDKQKVIMAFKIVLMVALSNTLIAEVIKAMSKAAILTTFVSNRIMYSIVAPIIEELGKYISIKQGCILEFNILFNTLEFVSYIMDFKSKQDSQAWAYRLAGVTKQQLNKMLMKYAGLRAMVVVMHNITIAAQNAIISAADKTDNENIKKLLNVVAVITGVAIHGLYNDFVGSTGVGKRINAFILAY